MLGLVNFLCVQFHQIYSSISALGNEIIILCNLFRSVCWHHSSTSWVFKLETHYLFITVFIHFCWKNPSKLLLGWIHICGQILVDLTIQYSGTACSWKHRYRQARKVPDNFIWSIAVFNFPFCFFKLNITVQQK